MVRAWLVKDDIIDPRQENQLDSPQPVSLDELHAIGVDYVYAPNVEDLEKIAKQRNYEGHDVITINRELLPDYDAKIKNFFAEHLHTDEEIRYVLEGHGYFDVRDKQDRWVRILTEPGDLVVLPAGIYHRFTPDTGDYIKAIRYFQGLPKWEAHNRSAETDASESRQSYVKTLAAA